MAKSADAFRTISEVADWLGVQTHVLRFWESKFTQIKPVKRAGGRRYYRPADMLLLGGIRKLLHDDGLTIKGVQKLLREEGMAHVSDMSGPLDEEAEALIDGDLVADAGFVEAELAPEDTATTVTPFAPINRPEPAAEPTLPEPTTISAPTSDDIVEPEATVPEPEDPVAVEPDMIPDVAAAPDPVTTPSETAPQEPVAASMDPDPKPATVSEDDAAAPEPMFARAPDTTSVPAAEERPAPIEIPSFLAGRAKGAPQTTDITPEPVDAAPQTTAPASEPVKPKPRIVHVPDEVAPESLDVAPSALTKASRVKQLSPAQRSALRPLLAQLTALRDQMAGAGRDPR